MKTYYWSEDPSGELARLLDRRIGSLNLAIGMLLGRVPPDPAEYPIEIAQLQEMVRQLSLTGGV